MMLFFSLIVYPIYEDPCAFAEKIYTTKYNNYNEPYFVEDTNCHYRYNKELDIWTVPNKTNEILNSRIKIYWIVVIGFFYIIHKIIF